MELIRETLTQAKGWSSFDRVDNKTENQEYLEFAHKVAKTFSTPDGKEVLNAMVERYLLCDIASNADTQIGVGIKQGRASVVKHILAQIELSNNS